MLLKQIEEAVEYIRSKHYVKPDAGIILGTGLGGLVKDIHITTTISYKDIPHFPVSTVESHEGKLIMGKLGGKEVVVMQGRFHYYEGYTMQQITFPVRVMHGLGIEKIFISNAAGGLNPKQKVSDLMILNDHINLLPEHPLRGKNEASLGPRFPDMSKAYDAEFINLAKNIAVKNNIRIHEGVYAAVQGPTLETKAEYKYISIIGADAVGMSTIPECIVARHMDMRVFAISVITDLGVEGSIKETSLEDVINAATIAEPNLTMIFKELITLTC